MIRPNTKSGFTLIELLVSISMIGILASVILVSLSSVKDRARDAKTKQEISSIVLAIQQYYTEYGGYPNPYKSTGQTMFCIGSTDCIVAGNSVSTEFPDTIAEAKKIKTNDLASIFANYPSLSTFTDPNGFENKGYIYVSCQSSDDTCGANSSYLIYPLSNGEVAMNVGDFSTSACEISGCTNQDNSSDICGGSGNDACSNYSNTPGACNYDPNGSGSSSGTCTCGNGSENCNNYCDTDSSACNFSSQGTGSCDYSCHGAYCTGSITTSCGYPDQGSCTGNPACSWTNGSSDTCSGTPLDCSNWSDQWNCGNHSGCSWDYDNNICSGAPTSCDSYSYQWDCQTNGCSWGGYMPGYCYQNGGVSCSSFSDQTSCQNVGCNWSTY